LSIPVHSIHLHLALFAILPIHFRRYITFDICYFRCSTLFDCLRDVSSDRDVAYRPHHTFVVVYVPVRSLLFPIHVTYHHFTFRYTTALLHVSRLLLLFVYVLIVRRYVSTFRTADTFSYRSTGDSLRSLFLFVVHLFHSVVDPTLFVVVAERRDGIPTCHYRCDFSLPTLFIPLFATCLLVFITGYIQPAATSRLFVTDRTYVSLISPPFYVRFVYLHFGILFYVDTATTTTTYRYCSSIFSGRYLIHFHSHRHLPVDELDHHLPILRCRSFICSVTDHVVLPIPTIVRCSTIRGVTEFWLPPDIRCYSFSRRNLFIYHCILFYYRLRLHHRCR